MIRIRNCLPKQHKVFSSINKRLIYGSLKKSVKNNENIWFRYLEVDPIFEWKGQKQKTMDIMIFFCQKTNFSCWFCNHKTHFL